MGVYTVIDADTKVESHPINAERLRAYHSGNDLFPGRDKGNKILVEDEEIEEEEEEEQCNKKQSNEEDSEEDDKSPSCGTEGEKRVNQMPGIRAGADNKTDDPVEGKPLDKDKEDTDGDQWFEVEKLLKMKRVRGSNWFLVKWTGGEPNSWQKEDDISD